MLWDGKSRGCEGVCKGVVMSDLESKQRKWGKWPWRADDRVVRPMG